MYCTDCSCILHIVNAMNIMFMFLYRFIVYRLFMYFTDCLLNACTNCSMHIIPGMNSMPRMYSLLGMYSMPGRYSITDFYGMPCLYSIVGIYSTAIVCNVHNAWYVQNTLVCIVSLGCTLCLQYARYVKYVWYVQYAWYLQYARYVKYVFYVQYARYVQYGRQNGLNRTVSVSEVGRVGQNCICI